MTNQLPPVVGVNTGQKSVIRNVGVARIQGSDLLAQGKYVNWLYLITDIGALATYENQGEDVWLGADGIAVAGNTAVLTSLVPREGQSFYNIQTNQPLLYKGGAWGGASWAAFQVLAPTTIVLNASATLEPQRDYVVVADGLAILTPDSTRAANGHIFRVYVPVGSTGTILNGGAGTTLTSLDIPNIVDFELLQAQVYEFVYYDTVWYSFTESANLYLRRDNNLADLTDAEASRTNLNVWSREEVLALIQSVEATPDGGLLATGIVGNPGTPRQFRVDFATAQEVDDGLETSKAISPAALTAVLQQKVDAAVGASKYNTVTGLVSGSAAFTVTATPPTTIVWTEANIVINPDPALLTEDVVFGTLPAGSIEVPNIAGYVLHYLQCTSAGAVSFTTNSAVNPLALRFAVVLVKDGTIQWLIPMPQLATADYFLRGKVPSITGGTVSPVLPGTLGQLTSATTTLMAESVNWVVKVPDLNYLLQPAVVGHAWTYWRNELLELSTNQTVVDGRLYSDGSSVPAANFTIQNILRDWGGNLHIVAGRTQFTTMALAVAGLAGAPPLIPSQLQGCLTEVGRVILKGDQHSGNAELDLADDAKARFYTAAQLGGGGSEGAGAADDVRIVLATGELQYEAKYAIVTADPIGLPAVASDGAWIDVKSEYPFRPVLTVKNPGELIVDTVTGKESNQLKLDAYVDFTRLYIRDGKWRY